MVNHKTDVKYKMKSKLFLEERETEKGDIEL